MLVAASKLDTSKGTLFPLLVPLLDPLIGANAMSHLSYPLTCGIVSISALKAQYPLVVAVPE